EAPNALIKSTLFREPFVCIARRGHPALQDSVLSLDRFVEMEHVQALMKDGTMYAAAIDTALANHGLVRKVALWQPSFFALPHVVERTDLIGTVPQRVGVQAAETLAIEIYEVHCRCPSRNSRSIGTSAAGTIWDMAGCATESERVKRSD